MSKKSDAFSSGMRGGDKPKLSGDIESITIRPASNGFTMDVYKRPKGKGLCYTPPETTVHENAESLAEKVCSLLKVDC